MGALLKRSDSLPARLPSHPPERTEVEPIRHPVTRPTPDTEPPAHFTTDGDIRAGIQKKLDALRNAPDYYEILSPIVDRDPEFQDIIKTRHADFDSYSRAEKSLHAGDMLSNHPRFMAKMAKARNVVSSLPNSATASRTMKPLEQQFLTRAFRYLRSHFERFPHRVHGETAVIGNRRGVITQAKYSPDHSIDTEVQPREKYHLHTHPPFGEPFTSSASKQDHIAAAEVYTLHRNKMNAYVTNGKDVLHIQPDSTELVKLIPDPRWERKLGKFPVAFALPDPRQPPHPFSNHEAPAAFAPWENEQEMP